MTHLEIPNNIFNLGKRGMHIPKNEVPPVPEIQGKAKTTKERAKPITEKK